MMIYNLIIAALLVGAFFMCLLCFLLGAKWGKDMSMGKVPKLNIMPLKTQDNANQDAQTQTDIETIMGYSEAVALDAIKKLRG